MEVYQPGAAYGIRELRQYFALNAAGENVLARRVGLYFSSARLEGLARKDEQVCFAVLLHQVHKPGRVSCVLRRPFCHSEASRWRRWGGKQLKNMKGAATYSSMPR